MVNQKIPDDGEKKNAERETITSSFKKKLSSSGGGDGVSLHINAPLAREYDLNPDTEVEVSVVEEGGDVAFRVDIPAGFTHEDLEIFASEEGWELVDKYVEEDGQWSLTYQTEGKEGRISIDSESRIDGHHVNNVLIESAAIGISSYSAYQDVATAALRKGLQVRLRDSEGLWQKLRGSTDHETEDAPDEETVEKLIENVDWVSVQLVEQKTSTKTTLKEIGEDVESICSAISELEEKLDDRIQRFGIDQRKPDEDTSIQKTLDDQLQDSGSA